jgi:hypothetical protein
MEDEPSARSVPVAPRHREPSRFPTTTQTHENNEERPPSIRQTRSWFLDVFPISSVSEKRFPMASSDDILLGPARHSFSPAIGVVPVRLVG